MTEIRTNTISESRDEAPQHRRERAERIQKRHGLLGLELWEIGAILLAISLIAFVAIPNYFYTLKELRGNECSSRLTLLANCLQYLADKNETKPGEKICEQFDLNELLEQVQNKQSFALAQGGWYYKVGAEPDCAGVGDHHYSLYLGADGSIVTPTCTMGTETNVELGLHACDLTKVTGKLGIFEEASSDSSR
ncbi:MAG: hypothetical protein C4527_18925 [Candidatus Omnitrophota bacterium]|jgi:hypothetical protein|nr:MAG: hypothetical protein C4527_18925 [Candidatus Omnitrophota bacterium]